MQSNTNFNLSVSGQPFTVPNDLQNSTSITVSYVPTNLTQSYAVAVEGLSSQTGESFLLDTFSGTGASGIRTINLAVAWDSFKLIPTWTGAAQNFSVGATLASGSGTGPTFASNLDLPVIHTV